MPLKNPDPHNFRGYFVLALKGTAGIIFLLSGAFTIYFTRKEGSIDKLVNRVTHKE